MVRNYQLATIMFLVVFWLSTRSKINYTQDQYFIKVTRHVFYSHNLWSKFKWMKNRVLYYPNSAASFNILVCSDIHPHPVPVQPLSRPYANTNSTNRSVLHCYYQIVRRIRSGSKLKEFNDVLYSNTSLTL